MATSTLDTQLVAGLQDRLTGPARGITATLMRLEDAMARNTASLAAMRSRMQEAAGAGSALLKGLSAPVNAAIAFEKAMADVRRSVGFDSETGFRQMGEDIRALSLRVPVAASGIADIVAAAGNAGVAQGELVKFAELAAKVGTAWDTGAAQTGDALAQLKATFGLSLADTASLADAIGHLGKNSAASAPQIMDAVRGVGPMAGTFGMTAEQVAATSAAMIGAGADANAAAAGILNIGTALTAGATATGRQNAVFKTLGLSARGVARDMQTNAVGTLEDVLARINRLPAAARAGALSGLFGDSAGAIAPLVSGGSTLSGTLAMVAERSSYAGSVSRDFEATAVSTAFEMQILSNRVNDLAVSIGMALLPVIGAAAREFGPMVTSLSDLVRAYPQVTAAIATATAAVIGFRMVTGVAGWAVFLLKGELLKFASGAASIATGIRTVALAIGSLARAAILGPVIAAFNGVRTAMIGFAATASIVGNGAALKMMAGSLLGLLNPMALVRGAFVALRIAMLASGVGAILLGIGLAGAFIYNNWDGIGQMFRAFGSAYMQAIEPLRPLLDPVIEGVSRLFNWISDLVGPVDGFGQSWSAMGAEAGTALGELTAKIVALPGEIIAQVTAWLDAGSALVQSLWDGAASKFEEFLAWVKGIPASIAESIGNIDLSGIISWPQPPAWWRSLFGGDDVIDGARKAGGPVRAGGTYLVGENGPELFSPGRSGVISPNAAYEAVSGGNGAARGAVTVTVQPTFYNSQVSSTQALSSEILGQLDATTKSAVESSFSR